VVFASFGGTLMMLAYLQELVRPSVWPALPTPAAENAASLRSPRFCSRYPHALQPPIAG
jgi:hypothetical protein